MPTTMPFRRRRRALFSARNLFYLTCVGAAGIALHASFQDQYAEILAPLTAESSVARPGPDPANLPTVIKLAPAPSGTSGGPKIIDLGAERSGAITGSILPGRILVVDGDTIHLDGKTYRLVGIDTPESGRGAKCAAERELAARATRRLRQIVAGADLRLQRVDCGCPAGTEGTDRCNHGCLCAVLTTANRDVGQILIGEGLARRYNCVGAHCPPKQSWCA